MMLELLECLPPVCSRTFCIPVKEDRWFLLFVHEFRLNMYDTIATSRAFPAELGDNFPSSAGEAREVTIVL